MNTIAEQNEQAQAMEELKLLLKPGDTVYTILRHVSKSGNYRSVDLVIVRDDMPVLISWLARNLIGWLQDQVDGGISITGCGSDAGFELVYNLSCVLFRDGYALKQRWL